MLDKKEKASSMVEYAPIAKALADASINEVATGKLKRKFDVAYMIVKENLSFTKMPSICE